MYTKVLLPMDGSPCSFAAAEYARDLLNMNPSAQLTILYVRRKPERAYRAYRWSEVEVPLSEEEKRRICEAEERILTPAEKIFTGSGLVTDNDVVQGTPAEEIRAYAQRGGYDLIVMGLPPAGENKDFFSENVIHNVLQAVKCPVLLVKG
jgi:nucleotide-binding universal stress UspA family protein